MTLPDRIEGALARLTAALHRLQAAAEQRAAADASFGDRDQEFTLLQDDRSRLAAELDAALSREARLAAAQEEVADRLDRAGRRVEQAMHGLEGRAPGPPSLDDIFAGGAR